MMETTFHLLLYRAFHMQRSYLRPCLREIGLGSGQPKLLSYIAAHPNCRPKELADYFETSVDYLVGHTPKGKSVEPSPDECTFLRGYRAVSEAERESLRLVLRNYLLQQENIDDGQK